MLVWSRVLLTMPVLDDVLAPGLRVVFCGTAPGRASAARGAYYAHPQNRFWRVLHEVGFTPRQLRPEEFREVLQYGLGLTDIAKHTFGMDSQLPAGSLGPEATRALRERIDFYQPRVLAFTSVTGGSRYLGRKARLGLQPERVGKTIVWVLPSPAPTANWRWDAGPWRQLAGFVVTG